jgi:hypothetical protein
MASGLSPSEAFTLFLLYPHLLDEKRTFQHILKKKKKEIINQTQTFNEK